MIRSLPPDPAVLARAADVEDEDLVAPRGELRGQVVVGDRPEGGVEAQAVAEDDRQLARVGLCRAVVADAQPPAVPGVGVAVGAGAEVAIGALRRIVAQPPTPESDAPIRM